MGTGASARPVLGPTARDRSDLCERECEGPQRRVRRLSLHGLEGSTFHLEVNDATTVADVSHAIGRSPGAAVMLTSGGKAAWPFLTDGWSPDPSPLGACQQSSSEKVLLIRPTFLGPCSMVLFFGSFFMMLPVTTMSFNQSWGPFGLIVRALGALLFVFIAGTFISLALRAYFRSVERLLEELRNISVENCRCACCDLDHTMDGANLLCDREIVKECVSIWFGSLEAFEESIRSELSDAMATGLKDRVFTRGWSLSVTTPILWAYFDVAVSWAAAGDVLWFFLILLDGWVLWFLCGPIYADYLTFITCRYCRRARPEQYFGRVRGVENGRYSVDVVGGGRKAGLDAVTPCSEEDLQKAQLAKSKAFQMAKLIPRPSLPRTVSNPELDRCPELEAKLVVFAAH
eukprot:g31045.t1